MTKKTIGATLKTFRKKKGWTQEQLALGGSDSPTSKICDKDHYARIERDIKVPSAEMLLSFLSALGVSLAEFETVQHGNGLQLFKNDFEHLWAVGYKREYQTMGILLDQLKNKEYCDTSVLTIQQALYLAEAVLFSSRDNKHMESLEMLRDAISITAPTVLSKKCDIKCDKIAELILSENEYRILRMLANVTEKLGKPNNAISVYQAITASLENEMTSPDMKKRFLPSTYFNLSNILLRQEKHDIAKGVIDCGLEFCYNTNEPKTLGKLYWNMGEAFRGKGDKDNALHWYNKAYQHSVYCGYTQLLKHMEDSVMKHFGVALV